ncbi:MAG: hypothetical protein CM15mV141_020 [uncultured marine virus]|nr:MAG: hypothetical protein CM15mV141_020 [uncultured marine virus]
MVLAKINFQKTGSGEIQIGNRTIYIVGANVKLGNKKYWTLNLVLWR